MTTIPNSFYKQNLSHSPIEPLNKILEVEAANGQDVPYLGYVEVNITFPKSALGLYIEVSILFLIVPDMRSTLSSVLIGTNTLDILHGQYSDATPQNFQSLPYGYRVVLQTLEMRQKQQAGSSLGVVRPEVIGPGETRVVEGSVNCSTPNAGKWVVVDPQKTSSLPNEWKEWIIEKLNSMPDVFAQHDLDFGRTDKIKHHIKLSDETPFKHKARPIHPQDIEAVRKHLQELLEAEIIHESESPFSSPIVVVRKKNGDVRLCIYY